MALLSEDRSPVLQDADNLSQQRARALAQQNIEIVAQQRASNIAAQGREIESRNTLIKNIANGKYGNGKKREAKLAAMGVSSADIQSQVNDYVKARPEYATKPKTKRFGGTSGKSGSVTRKPSTVSYKPKGKKH